MEQQETWWIEYGDDIDIEVPRPAGPRHAKPRAPRQRRPLVRRLIRWAIVYAVLYAVAAVVLALHPPMMRLYFPVEPAPTAQTVGP